MTERSDTHSEEGAAEQRDWASEAEEALEGVGNALREAWEASREARLSALESARKAALQLGDAIDQGVAAARQKWEEAQPRPSDETPDTPAVPAPPKAPNMGPDDGRSDTD